MYKDYSDIGEIDTDIDAIKNSIYNIITTSRGSVPGKPTFGSDIYKILFSPLDDLTISLAENYVKEALDEFEDRIVVESVEMTKVEEFNKLIIVINFYYAEEVSMNESTIYSTSISLDS